MRLFRRIHCDGLKKAEACREAGCSVTSYHSWKLNPEFLAKAEELGPTGEGDGESPAVGDGGTFDNLPPIGEESPNDPSSGFLATLASYYSLRPEPAALDRLAGWPAGSVQGWFDRLGDVACATRVAVLERAREIRAAMLLEGLAASGNAVAMTKLAISLGAMTEAPVVGKNAAEGQALDAIKGELLRRIGGA